MAFEAGGTGSLVGACVAVPAAATAWSRFGGLVVIFSVVIAAAHP